MLPFFAPPVPAGGELIQPALWRRYVAQVGAHLSGLFTGRELLGMYWDELIRWREEARAIYQETWGLRAADE